MMKITHLSLGFFWISILCCVFALYQYEIFHSFFNWMKYTNPTQNNLQKDFRLDFKYGNITKLVNGDKSYYKTITELKENNMNFQGLSEEAFNSSSPYYGLFYKNIYGKSLGKVRQTLFKKINQNWKYMFPNLMLSLKKQQQFNPSRNKSLYTSAASIVIKNSYFNLGDEFAATIFSMDGLGRHKTFGGDLYRARLVRGNGSYPDGIPCRVIDNLDGSYTIKAPLVLEGTLTLLVTLALPVDGIRDAIEETSKFTCSMEGYMATLESNETVVCRFVGRCFKNDVLCDYSNPFNKAVWVCQAPESGKCSPIKNIYFGNNVKNLPRFGACNYNKCNIKLEKETISVKRNYTRKDELPNLPECKQFFKNQITSNLFVKVSGFFNQSYWRSTICKSKQLQWPMHNLKDCLNNKVIYMLGDSTVRQFFQLTMKKLSLKRFGEDNSKVWQMSSIAYHHNVHQQNTTVYYRAHGPPLKNPGPPSSRPYIADSIAGLMVGGRNVFVVFNLGAHFYNYEPSVFVHRLKGIKYAIEIHHKSFPETKFLLKGLNVIQSLKLRYEWFAYRLEIILRSMFTNMNNLVYLDFWDVTTVWPLDSLHPHPTILEQEAYLMFSYMC